MHNVLVQWHVSDRLARVQRALGKGMGAERKPHEEARMAELGEAYLFRGLAQAWRIARVMARKPLGPKRRTMDAVTVTSPSLAQWNLSWRLQAPREGAGLSCLQTCLPSHCCTQSALPRAAFGTPEPTSGR